MRSLNRSASSVSTGVPASTVKEQLLWIEDELGRIEIAIAKNKSDKRMIESNALADALREMLTAPDYGHEHYEELVATFVDYVFAGEDGCVLVFSAETNPGFEQIRLASQAVLKEGKKQGETAGQSGVRLEIRWWRRGESNSGPY